MAKRRVSPSAAVATMATESVRRRDTGHPERHGIHCGGNHCLGDPAKQIPKRPRDRRRSLPGKGGKLGKELHVRVVTVRLTLPILPKERGLGGRC
jgi:hypothetical protein